MSKNVVTFPPATLIRTVIREMLAKKIGAVVIVEGERPVGIFSERDVLRGLESSVDNLLDKPVSAAMTPDPVTVSRDMGFAQAMDMLEVRNIRHLPVVEGGKMIGILSIKDMLRSQLKFMRERMKVMVSAESPGA